MFFFSIWKVDFEEISDVSYWENVCAMYVLELRCYNTLLSGQLSKFSSKSGPGRLREVVGYKRYVPNTVIWLRNF